MAIRKQFNLFRLDLDVGRWKRQMRKDMTEEVKDAARDWLRTVLAIVPVWSRASHATFRPLADAVGFVIPTQPLEARKDRSAFGEAQSRGGIETEGDKFVFFYETNLSYLAFNEFNAVQKGDENVYAGLQTPTPYNFTGQAAAQFRERQPPELPNPFDYLKASRL